MASKPNPWAQLGLPPPTTPIAQMTAADIEALLFQLVAFSATHQQVVARITRQITRRTIQLQAEEKRSTVAPIVTHPQLPYATRSSLAGDGLYGLNGLIDTLICTKPNEFQVIADICHELVTKTGGLTPLLSLGWVLDTNDNELPRLICQWSVPGLLTPATLQAISYVVAQTFDHNIDLRLTERKYDMIAYRDCRRRQVNGLRGVYFGTSSWYNAAARGLTVTRKFSSLPEAKYLHAGHPDDWLCRAVSPAKKARAVTYLEFREGHDKETLRQEWLIYLVVQVSHLLATGHQINPRQLLASVYQSLNCFGFAPVARDQLFGMQEVVAVLDRILLTPLLHADAARRLGLEMESVVLAGVPGVGKTFLARYLMSQNIPALFVALGTHHLQQLLKDNPMLSQGDGLLARIEKIGHDTGLPLVLLIDDIEAIMTTDDKNQEDVVRMLNLLAGVRRRGFNIIASSNYPDRIDPRLYQPGRLSRLVHVRRPNDQERRGVLEIYFNQTVLAPQADVAALLDWLVDATAGWTQRFLRDVVHEAGRLCLVTSPDKNPATVGVTRDHLVQALAEVATRINLRDLNEADNRIAQFVRRHNKAIGFSA